MRIELTEDELALLDGQCREEVQKEVDAAKERIRLTASVPNELPVEQAEFVRKVAGYAQENGRLRFAHTNIRFCSICKKSAGYAKHTRRGKYHNKGDNNYKKPLTMRAVDMDDSGIRMIGHASYGCCLDCWNKVQPVLAEVLDGVKAEIPSCITGHAPKWKKHELRECRCGWHGKESDMGKLRTLMGDGHYAGKCPGCGAENSLFSSPVKRTGKWVAESVEADS